MYSLDWDELLEIVSLVEEEEPSIDVLNITKVLVLVALGDGKEPLVLVPQSSLVEWFTLELGLVMVKINLGEP